MPAATSEVNTRIRTKAAIGRETVSAWTQVLLGLLGRVPGERRVAAEQQLDAVARLVDLRLEPVEQRDRRLVGDVEVDDHVGRLAVGAR